MGAELTYDLAWHRGIENIRKTSSFVAHIRNRDDMHYKDDAGCATAAPLRLRNIDKLLGRISAITIFARTGCMAMRSMSMNVSVWSPAQALIWLFLAAVAASICAAAYPERPIRLVCPQQRAARSMSSDGSSASSSANNWAKIVIDNRGGANNIIGTEIAARSPPDGYTLLITAGAHTINPAVYRKLPYDALRDFTPISHIANSGGLVIVVHPLFGARTLQQLIDMARASPGKIVYGSAGFGNSTHIAGEMFQVMAGVKLIHVPYKGAGPAVNDLLGGQIPLMFGPSPVVVPMVQAGRLRPLAFTGLKRSSQLPDVPTVDEAGVKGYENSGWYGCMDRAACRKRSSRG